MEQSKELITQIQKLHVSAKQKVQRLNAELEEAIQDKLFWEKYLKYLNEEWPLHMLDLIEKEAFRLKKLRERNHPAIPLIEESFHMAKEDATRIFRRYPSLLEDACRDAGLCLDSSSRHPRYSMKQGFFNLEIDEGKRIAKISDYEGRLVELPADINAVIERVKQEHDRIFCRKFDGEKFLKQLRNQYKAIIKKDGLTDSESVPIRQITRRMGKNIKGFRSDEFLIDLSRLAEKGPYEIDNKKLDLQQTKDTNQGMLLHGAEKRGYIGYILFKEVHS